MKEDMSPKVKATQEWLVANFEEALGSSVPDPAKRKELAKKLVQIYQLIESGELFPSLKAFNLRVLADKVVANLLKNIKERALNEEFLEGKLKEMNALAELLRSGKTSYKGKELALREEDLRRLKSLDDKEEALIQLLMNLLRESE